jgi:hypothetical protein
VIIAFRKYSSSHSIAAINYTARENRAPGKIHATVNSFVCHELRKDGMLVVGPAVEG